jgi:hypothetical protein
VATPSLAHPALRAKHEREQVQLPVLLLIVRVERLEQLVQQPIDPLEILSPRGDLKSPSLFISPRELAMTPRPEDLRHPIGVRRVTEVRLVTPGEYEPAEAVAWARDAGLLRVDRGEQWRIELTFDGGARRATKDFRPALPLRIRY